MHCIFSKNKHQLIDTVIDQSLEKQKVFPDKRAFIIVPETSKFEIEKRYIQRAKSQSLLLSDINSFNRFLFRLEAECGYMQENILDPVSELLLTTHIIQSNISKLKLFQKLGSKWNYLEAINKVIGDFKRYNITPEDLSAVSNAQQNQDQLFAEKSADFSYILSLYNEKLQEIQKKDYAQRMIDMTEILKKLSANADIEYPFSRLKFLQKTSIWIVGFGEDRSLTPIEQDFILALDQVVESMTITGTSDSIAKNREDILVSEPQYKFTKEMFYQLGIKPIQNDPILSLEDKKAPFDLVHINFPTIQDEIQYTTGEIKRILYTKKYRYRDIAIVLGSDSYQIPLTLGLKKENIPHYLGIQNETSGGILLDFILGVIDLKLERFSLKSMLKVLRSGILNCSLENTDIFENICLKRNLKNERIFKQANDLSDPERELIIPILQILKPFQQFWSKQEIEQTTTEWVKAWKKLFIDIDVKAKIKHSINVCIGDKDTVTATHMSKSWNQWVSVLVHMQELIPDVPLRLIDFKLLIDRIFQNIPMQSIATSLDEVFIGDLKQATQSSYKAIFVLGSSDKTFPNVTQDEGFYKDSERMFLNSILETKQMPVNRQDIHVKVSSLLYQFTQSIEERLYLFQQANEESAYILGEWKANRPEYINQIKEITVDLQKNNAQDIRLLNLEYQPMLSQNQQINWDLERFKQDKAIIIREPQINPDQLQAYLGSELKLSISKLEQYASCPYAYLMESILNIRERDVWKVDQLKKGTLYHALMEAVFITKESFLEMQSLLYQDIPKAIDRVQEYLNKQLQKEGYKPYLDEEYQRSEMRKITNQGVIALSHAMKMHEEYCTEGVEARFKLENQANTNVNIIINGVIDRIDKIDENTYQVIDYKTSVVKNLKEKIYSGLSFQMPVYIRHMLLQKNIQPDQIDARYFSFTKAGDTNSTIPYKPLKTTLQEDALKTIIDNVLKTKDRTRLYFDLSESCGSIQEILAHSQEHMDKQIQGILTGRFPLVQYKPEKLDMPVYTGKEWLEKFGYSYFETNKYVIDKPITEDEEKSFKENYKIKRDK